MTTIGITHDDGRTVAEPAARQSIARQALLTCGVLSSLLYAATDAVGGVRYPGYSFASQAISELAAIGAPTQALVVPLFLAYGLFALAFGVGVFREGAGHDRALRITGALLIAYAAVGFTGFTLFPMHQRGGPVGADIGHIIVTGVIVLLSLAAMAFGAFALGRRFRIYSLVTVLIVIGFGALTTPFPARMAAGQPTPGFGIIERIDVYTLMLWFAVLAIALLRRARPHRRYADVVTATPRVHGTVAPGFEEVRAEFERNFAERGEIGAAVAAYWRGEKVVDLWGGRRAPESDAPWDEDTMVIVMSTTKGLSAMTLAVANARGWLDYDAPVARYWPEFAQNSKGTVTVRQLLAHEAGTVLLDEPLSVGKLRDLDYVARVVARQKPAWTPGTRHGYHTLTIGLCMQEIIRRVDPQHRSLGQFFHEEIAAPLGLEFYIGLPRSVPSERLATLETLSRTRGLMALRYTPFAMTMKMIAPGSLLRRSFVGTNFDYRDRESFEVEVPAGNGVGTARSIARAYSAFAEGGAELGITPETFARLTEPPVVHGEKDVVLGVPSHFSLGFLRPGPKVSFGSSERAFGAPGAGGSFAFADPDARLGYAYVMNKLDFHLQDDPREKSLRDAVYRAITRRVLPTTAGPDDVSRAGSQSPQGKALVILHRAETSDMTVARP
jgi:CubicO group peptidase (beta-lactamase class C family)/hypothetical membrane protein